MLAPRSAAGSRHLRRAGSAEYWKQTANFSIRTFIARVPAAIVPDGRAGGGTTTASSTARPLFPKLGANAPAPAPRFRDAVARLCPDADLAPHCCRSPGSLTITPWGRGPAGRPRLSRRYAFRIAFTNKRIWPRRDETVTLSLQGRAADARERKPSRPSS